MPGHCFLSPQSRHRGWVSPSPARPDFLQRTNNAVDQPEPPLPCDSANCREDYCPELPSRSPYNRNLLPQPSQQQPPVNWSYGQRKPFYKSSQLSDEFGRRSATCESPPNSRKENIARKRPTNRECSPSRHDRLSAGKLDTCQRGTPESPSNQETRSRPRCNNPGDSRIIRASSCDGYGVGSDGSRFHDSALPQPRFSTCQPLVQAHAICQKLLHDFFPNKITQPEPSEKRKPVPAKRNTSKNMSKSLTPCQPILIRGTYEECCTLSDVQECPEQSEQNVTCRKSLESSCAPSPCKRKSKEESPSKVRHKSGEPPASKQECPITQSCYPAPYKSPPPPKSRMVSEAPQGMLVCPDTTRQLCRSYDAPRCKQSHKSQNFSANPSDRCAPRDAPGCDPTGPTCAVILTLCKSLGAPSSCCNVPPISRIEFRGACVNQESESPKGGRHQLEAAHPGLKSQTKSKGTNKDESPRKTLSPDKVKNSQLSDSSRREPLPPCPPHCRPRNVSSPPSNSSPQHQSPPYPHSPPSGSPPPQTHSTDANSRSPPPSAPPRSGGSSCHFRCSWPRSSCCSSSSQGHEPRTSGLTDQHDAQTFTEIIKQVTRSTSTLSKNSTPPEPPPRLETTDIFTSAEVPLRDQDVMAIAETKDASSVAQVPMQDSSTFMENTDVEVSTQVSAENVSITSPKYVPTESERVSSTSRKVSSERVPSTPEKISSEKVPSTSEKVSSEKVPSTSEKVSSEKVPSTCEKVSSEKVPSTSEKVSSETVPSTSEKVSSEKVPSTSEKVSSEKVLSTSEKVSDYPEQISNSTHSGQDVLDRLSGSQQYCRPSVTRCSTNGVPTTVPLRASLTENVPIPIEPEEVPSTRVSGSQQYYRPIVTRSSTNGVPTTVSVRVSLTENVPIPTEPEEVPSTRVSGSQQYYRPIVTRSSTNGVPTTVPVRASLTENVTMTPPMYVPTDPEKVPSISEKVPTGLEQIPNNIHSGYDVRDRVSGSQQYCRPSVTRCSTNGVPTTVPLRASFNENIPIPTEPERLPSIFEEVPKGPEQIYSGYEVPDRVSGSQQYRRPPCVTRCSTRVEPTTVPFFVCDRTREIICSPINPCSCARAGTPSYRQTVSLLRHTDFSEPRPRTARSRRYSHSCQCGMCSPDNKSDISTRDCSCGARAHSKCRKCTNACKDRPCSDPCPHQFIFTPNCGVYKRNGPTLC